MGIEDLLDQTQAAALRGDVAMLASLAPRVETFLASGDKIDPALAERLRDKARRNLALLEASRLGMRAAGARLRDILGGPTLTTYDATGHKAAIAPVSATLPRRC